MKQLAAMDERYGRAANGRDFGSPAERPACVCRLYSAGGVAQIDEVGTVEARRGRGHASAAVLAAADGRRGRGLRPDLPAHRRQRLAQALVPHARLPRDRLGLRVPQAADGSGPAIIEGAMELTPCIVQDARTGEVLTLAYVNDESLARTRETGEMWFWSRSRGELWHKGETSGNVQRLRALRYDCDEDAFLALVDPAGPACHTGERTCFYRGEMEPLPAEAPATLERTIAARRAADPGESYTAALLADPQRNGAKVEEEAEEVARAARDEPDERVAEEAADVLYHLAVLLAGRGLSLADAYEVLNERRR